MEGYKLILEAFLAAVIHGLLAPEFTKIRDEVVKKVKNRIRSQRGFGERALNRPISDFSEKDHDEIRNIVATTLEEYGVSKEIKNTLAESYSTVLSTKSMHVVRIMNGVDEGREHILEVIDVTKDIRIGRCSVCEIGIPPYDSHAGRHHARIFVENGEYFIEDMCSRNGTWVNGVRIEGKTKLCDRDGIEVGRTLQVFNEKEEVITVISKAEGRRGYKLKEIKMREDVRIGRCPVNKIRIDEKDIEASRHHARAFFKEGEYFIEDICSSNGTFVNGVKIEEKKRLEDEDEIKMGNTLMQFRRVEV
jgi:pSer/pThr/pTyr-binding forkhead associated (FHA) protein